MDLPGDLPDPPADLASCSPLLQMLPIGTRLVRLHPKTKDPLFFGRTGLNRFDSPDGTYGVLYVGYDEHCAFIETFGHSTGIRIVTISELRDRHLAYLVLKQPLRLIDLATSGGLARLRADGRLLTGSHAIAQRWSAALRSHAAKADGILYPARHDIARNACALFEVSVSVFDIVRAGSLADAHHSKLLAQLLDTYDFGLITE